MPREVNPYAKSRKSENPYAVYGDPRLPGWEWRVLKLWQGPNATRNDKYARAFCLVTSPMTGPGGDMGDTYCREVGPILISGEDVLAGVPREEVNW